MERKRGNWEDLKIGSSEDWGEVGGQKSEGKDERTKGGEQRSIKVNMDQIGLNKVIDY